METLTYIDSKSAGRAIAEFAENAESALQGLNMLSAETQGELQEDDALTWVRDHFAEFLRLLRGLKKDDQDLLTCYYVLGIAQATLGPLFKTTQTQCSYRVRAAMKALCALSQGKPDAARLRAALDKAGLEGDFSVPVSQLVAEYEECRSFQRLADKYDIHRPAVRKAMRHAAVALGESQDPEAQMLGAYIHTLIAGAHRWGKGMSKRKAIAMGDVRRSDPDSLGDFRVKVDSEEFYRRFIGRASH